MAEVFQAPPIDQDRIVRAIEIVNLPFSASKVIRLESEQLYECRQGDVLLIGRDVSHIVALDLIRQELAIIYRGAAEGGAAEEGAELGAIFGKGIREALDERVNEAAAMLRQEFRDLLHASERASDRDVPRLLWAESGPGQSRPEPAQTFTYNIHVANPDTFSDAMAKVHAKTEEETEARSRVERLIKGVAGNAGR